MAIRLAVLSILVTSAFASQTVFTSPANLGTAQEFIPAGTLDILSETSFTALAHPKFPKYGVRIKKSNFCDETVRSYTGYIDIEARHLFFYFFESRSEPDRDDVIFWTNGGPGCSSGFGLLMELGPCRVESAANGTKFHPESWNSKANVFFIDQPIGTGFSYADHGEKVDTTEDAAKDIAAFVAIFFAHFKKFQGRGFHLAGESYGGRYLPVFAAEIYDQNSALITAGLPPINLTSVIIGNGQTDYVSQVPSWVDMQCSPVSIPPTPPIQDIKTCVHMRTILPRCQKWMKESCQDQFDLINCGAAVDFCVEHIILPYIISGRNPYDVTRNCEGSAGCYHVTEDIIEYLNKEDVQKLLGVRPGPYVDCNYDITFDFAAKLDMVKGSTEYVAALLERNVRVLVYAGAYDWICNWVGNERWTLDLEWSGQAEFGADPLREWNVNGKKAGTTRSAQGLTFAIVDAAGHMVPYDKPKEALEMINRWVAGKPL